MKFNFPRLTNYFKNIKTARQDRFYNKIIDRLYKTMPDVFAPPSRIDMLQTESVVPYPGDVNSLYLMKNSSVHLSNIINELNNETLRQIVEVYQTISAYCEECDIEYKEETKKCEKCGGKLTEPDIDEKFTLYKWLGKVNMPGRDDISFMKLMKIINNDVEITDELWVLVRKDYVVNNKGKIMDWKPLEIMRGSPERMRLTRERVDPSSTNVDKRVVDVYTCVLHRDNNIAGGPGVCRICGRELHPCVAVSEDDRGLPYIGYLRGEAYHESKYNPTTDYGFSQILIGWIEENTILNMNLQVNVTYREQRPPKGLIVFNTKNYEGLKASLLAEDKIREQKPMHIPRIAIDSDSKSGGAQWVQITPNYDELQTTEMKSDYIRRIAALYGVLPVFTGDTSTSGGLNNEGLQITVTLRAVQKGHQFYEWGLFPWLMKQLKIRFHSFRFPNPIEEDKVAKQERRMNNLNQIEKVLRMEADIEITDPEELLFDIKGDLKKPIDPEPWGGEGGGGQELDPEESYEPEVENLSKSRTIDEGEQFKKDLYIGYNSMFKDIMKDFNWDMKAESQKDVARRIVRDVRSKMEGKVTKNYASLIMRGFEDAGVNPAEVDVSLNDIRAIAEKSPIWKSFKSIDTSLQSKFEEIITDAFAVPGEFSKDNMVDRMKRHAADETWKLERIARTETNAVVNVGRDMGYEQRDPEGEFKYKLSGRFGKHSRTCEAHEWMNNEIQKAGGSVTKARLDELAKTAHDRWFPKLDQRGFNIHINQRKSYMRVIG